jgi:hypothetical protein
VFVYVFDFNQIFLYFFINNFLKLHLMLKVKHKVAGVLSGILLFLGNASAVAAQMDYEVSSSAGDEEAGLIVCGVYACLCIVGAAAFGFQIWMLVHAIKNAPEDQKTLWILLILLVGPIASVIYYFTKKKEFENSVEAAPVNQANNQVNNPGQVQ